MPEWFFYVKVIKLLGGFKTTDFLDDMKEASKASKIYTL